MKIVECRICGSVMLEDVIDLGEQYISSRFPIMGDYSTPRHPIVLCLCHECGLLQQRHTTPPNELYEQELYGYRSGISNTMKSHLQSYHQELVNKVVLQEGDIVLDIGSNDATFLKFYPKQLTRVGIDPTGKQFSSFYTDEVLIPDYFSEKAFRNRFPDKKCKIVSSIAMFYDLQDPVQFACDIEKILDKEGIWTCEQSYLLNMLETNSIDTICHEHLEYYALTQIKEIADRAQLKIINVCFNNSNGGSFRVYMAKKSSQTHKECSFLLHTILKKEKEICSVQTFQDFYRRCKTETHRLKMLIDAINQSGKNVWVYGASTKGNCTLQFADITKENIPFAVERNPQKYGKMTPTGVEIISEEKMRQEPPDYLLVLPWHFRKEIIERENVFLENGGALIFPFPHLEVFSLRPKLLVTGCGGHIASYFLDHYDKYYHIFGVGYNRKENRHGITQFFTHDDKSLVDCILTTRPDYIVHLAGISNSQKALENPVLTLDVNGRMIAVMCDCVFQNKLSTRIFNASSSDIFKGHKEYMVHGADNHYFHLHPYSIAKIMGHSIVDFYREKYKCPFYNGIIFMTESFRKSTDFLLNRLARHSNQWVLNKVPIHIGKLSSMRNIIHASDVAHAIHYILMGGYENYVICHDKSHPIETMVLDIYKKAGVELTRQDDNYIDRHTGNVVLMIDPYNDRNEPMNNIRGDNTALRKIGWTPKMSVDDILKEIINHHKVL